MPLPVSGGGTDACGPLVLSLVLYVNLVYYEVPRYLVKCYSCVSVKAFLSEIYILIVLPGWVAVGSSNHFNTRIEQKD